MPQELIELVFSLDDVVAGQPLTPDNVDLPTVRGFLEEVQKLIKGDVPGASLAESRVRIESGSLKVVAFVAQLLAADLRADMTRLGQSGDLDAIQQKRAQVIESWLGRARKSPTCVYSLGTGTLKPLCVTNASQFQHGSENAREFSDVDEQALASLWEKSRKAWKDVKSATGWVEELRGDS